MFGTSTITNWSVSSARPTDTSEPRPRRRRCRPLQADPSERIRHVHQHARRRIGPVMAERDEAANRATPRLGLLGPAYHRAKQPHRLETPAGDWGGATVQPVRRGPPRLPAAKMRSGFHHIPAGKCSVGDPSRDQSACYTKLQFDRTAHAWPQHIVLLAKPAIKCIR